jgi:hypothetical protein
MRGAYASHRYGKNRLSSDLLKIWAGATSRADLPEHHFPAQHGRITDSGVEFIQDSANFLRIKFKKLSKIQQLQEYITSTEAKGKYSLEQNNKLQHLLDMVAVKLGYGGGRADHAILDTRCHMSPKGLVNYEHITGKTPIPPELWGCNFAVVKELLGGGFRNMCTVHPPGKLLIKIHESYNIKPTRVFSLIDPKSWIDALKSSHVFVNLDHSGTINDQASIAATGKSAFFQAMKEGMRDTRRFWKEEVIEKVEKEIGRDKTNKTLNFLSNWKPSDQNILKGSVWEKIGEKSFDLRVAYKFKNPESEHFYQDGGPISDFVMYTLTPFIPYEYKRKNGIIKSIRQKADKTLKEIALKVSGNKWK